MTTLDTASYLSWRARVERRLTESFEASIPDLADEETMVAWFQYGVKPGDAVVYLLGEACPCEDCEGVSLVTPIKPLKPGTIVAENNSYSPAYGVVVPQPEDGPEAKIKHEAPFWAYVRWQSGYVERVLVSTLNTSPMREAS